MGKAIVNYSVHDYLLNFAQSSESNYSSNGIESQLSFEKGHFTGNIYGVQLFPGWSILKHDLMIHSSVHYHQRILRGYVKLSFYLNADIKVINSMGEKNLSSNHFKIDFFNNVDEQVLLMPNQKEYQSIDIVLRVGVLHNLIQQMELPDPIQKDLLQGLEQQQSNYYPLPLSLKEQIIELWNMKENGVFQLLSLQSKTSEVLYRLLEIFQSNTAQNDCKKIIEEVQHIIHNRLDNPPTIKELSKAVGINESKLKKEFKQQCKQTIFQYISYKRMKASKEMLLTNNYNIGEIADAIGYQNISKFIAAFKREYGTTPGQFKNDTHKLVPRNSSHV